MRNRWLECPQQRTRFSNGPLQPASPVRVAQASARTTWGGVPPPRTGTRAEPVIEIVGEITTSNSSNLSPWLRKRELLDELRLRHRPYSIPGPVTRGRDKNLK
jgi:hypothetical protein